MKNIIFGLMIVSALTITGCTKITISPAEETKTGEVITIKEPEIQIDMTDKKQVIEYTIAALKESNMEKLGNVISKQGVRFSPYSYVDTGRQITLKKEELKNAFEGNTEYVRGSEDGTGDPMILTFKNYLKKYVYDLDFQKLAEKNYDKIVQRGNTINNIEDIYSGTSTVEYFVPGLNPEYGGMDRRSLTLVLQMEDNERKVRAIVHNQRTI